ncbi:Usg family protein [Caulobacter sp. 17J80-11]|nr:Usg family protein [Caulobacter sp. 17J80-11]MBC6983380.1 Usg family protein [Caulobacter sp. 17J80-11]
MDVGASSRKGRRRRAQERVVNTEFREQLAGRRLTTAEITYYMPDHPALLQEFLWQTLDEAPEFPRVRRFLEFWRREIDAVIHSVRVSYVGVVAPARVRTVRELGRLQ